MFALWARSPIIKIHGKSFREFSLRESLFYLILLEKRAEPESLRSSMCLIIPFWITQSEGTLPFFPKKKATRNMFLAILLGFLIPFGFCNRARYVDDSIKDQRDLKKHFMIPQFGK